MGFRNPFRFTVDTDGTVYLADYGPDSGTDNTNRGPAGLVEWNVIKSPGNYGWPYCVANNIAFNDYNFATATSGPKFNCAAPTNNSPNNTGLTTLPAARPAHVWYGNGSNGTAFPELGGGGGEAPMAFPVYHYNPNNPSTTKFPQYFDKTPFFGEWARNTMHEFRLDSSGNLLKINRFLSSLSFKSPMDAKIRPGRLAVPAGVGQRIRPRQPRLGAVPHRLHHRQPRPNRPRQRHTHLRHHTAHSELHQRRIHRPAGCSADLPVDLRRRRHLHRGQPVAHLHRPRPIQRPTDRDRPAG